MESTVHLVLFQLDEQRYALPLSVVDRVVHAVEPTPLPDAPPLVIGIVDMHGSVLPVLDVRRRFGMPARPISAQDSLIVARTSRYPVMLLVDRCTGVIERPADALTPAGGIFGGPESFPGLLTCDDGVVLIHDLDRFLSEDDARALGESLADAGSR